MEGSSNRQPRQYFYVANVDGEPYPIDLYTMVFHSYPSGEDDSGAFESYFLIGRSYQGGSDHVDLQSVLHPCRSVDENRRAQVKGAASTCKEILFGDSRTLLGQERMLYESSIC